MFFRIGMGWAEPRCSAGVSAAFIFAHAAAGLCGETVSVHALPSAASLWACVVVVGGLIGLELGVRRLAGAPTSGAAPSSTGRSTSG